MPQQPENRQSDDDIDQLIPTASVDINPGDVLVSSRKHDPRSLALINATPGRCRPISAAFHGQWVAGVANGKFVNDGLVVSSTTYAAPTANDKVKVYRRGVHRLAISNTSGKKGDYVRYSSGASGAQVFVIDNRRLGWAIGRIAQDFSGATANDAQAVEILQHPQQGQSIYYFLENRVVEGCRVYAAAQPASRVRVGHVQTTVSARNVRIIQGKVFSGAATSVAFGGVGSAAASTVRFKYVMARSGTFAIRSGSGSKALLASFTASGVSIGLLTPVTCTAAEVPIALLVQFSAANQSNARIFNLRGPNLIPNVGSWGL